MKRIPIFFTFDNNYVEPAAVAFYSLLNKAKENVFYEMYVLHSNITDEKQEILQKIIKKFNNAKLNFINTDGFLDDFFKNGTFCSSVHGSTFTADTIVRCFASRFFPQYEKIIYSDVDVVFVDDISELFDCDLNENYILGVNNPFTKYSSDELSHLKPEHFEFLKDKYLAGGIWVMNLEKIRKDNLEERMMEVIQDETIIKRWNDQDIVNIACNGKTGLIPLNYIFYPYMLKLLNDKNFKSVYTRDEMFDSIINPKIIHYAAQKPWNNNPELSQIWWTVWDSLGLEKTSIFKKYVDKKEIKLKKYKKLTNLFLALFILSVLLNLTFAIKDFILN